MDISVVEGTPVSSAQPSINAVVDTKPDVDKFMAFDSLMNRKAMSSISGTTSINNIIVFGVKPMSHNVA